MFAKFDGIHSSHYYYILQEPFICSWYQPILFAQMEIFHLLTKFLCVMIYDVKPIFKSCDHLENGDDDDDDIDFSSSVATCFTCLLSKIISLLSLTHTLFVQCKQSNTNSLFVTPLERIWINGRQQQQRRRRRLKGNLFSEMDSFKWPKM